MQARIVPAARGAHWLVEGWRIFRAAPLGWLATVIAYLLLTNLLALVPIVGLGAALILVPPLSLGLMAAARAASRGAPVYLAILFSALRNEPRAQIMLGVVYMACSLVVFAAMTLADGSGALKSVLSGAAKPGQTPLGDVLAPLMVAALVYTPVMMAFWFAPPLASWHALGAAKSLFFSFVACVLNWRAFVAYGIAAALVLLVLPFVVLSIMMLASGGKVKLTVMGLVFPLLIVMLPTIFASFYASYRDVFGEAGGAPGGEPGAAAPPPGPAP